MSAGAARPRQLGDFLRSKVSDTCKSSNGKKDDSQDRKK